MLQEELDKYKGLWLRYDGNISKIQNVIPNDVAVELYEVYLINVDRPIKLTLKEIEAVSSDDIRDLIDVGDYINGKQIVEIHHIDYALAKARKCSLRVFIYEPRVIKCGDYKAGGFYDTEVEDIMTRENYKRGRIDVC